MPNGVYTPPTYGGFLGLIPEEQRKFIDADPAGIASYFGLDPEKYGEFFQRIDPSRIRDVLGQIAGERTSRLGMAQEQYGLGAERARALGGRSLLDVTRGQQVARAAGGFAGHGVLRSLGRTKAEDIRAGYGREMGGLLQTRGAQRFAAGQEAQTGIDKLLALITGQLGGMYETALGIKALDPEERMAGSLSGYAEWKEQNPGGTYQDYQDWLLTQGGVGGDETTRERLDIGQGGTNLEDILGRLGGGFPDPFR